MKSTSLRRSTATSALPRQGAFVLQLTVESRPQGGVCSGRVEHLETGAVTEFQSSSEMLTFLDATLSRTQTSN